MVVPENAVLKSLMEKTSALERAFMEQERTRQEQLKELAILQAELAENNVRPESAQRPPKPSPAQMPLMRLQRMYPNHTEEPFCLRGADMPADANSEALHKIAANIPGYPAKAPKVHRDSKEAKEAKSEETPREYQYRVAAWVKEMMRILYVDRRTMSRSAKASLVEIILNGSNRDKHVADYNMSQKFASMFGLSGHCVTPLYAFFAWIIGELCRDHITYDRLVRDLATSYRLLDKKSPSKASDRFLLNADKVVSLLELFIPREEMEQTKRFATLMCLPTSVYKYVRANMTNMELRNLAFGLTDQETNRRLVQNATRKFDEAPSAAAAERQRDKPKRHGGKHQRQQRNGKAEASGEDQPPRKKRHAASSDTVPVCQICKKKGHEALKCYQLSKAAAAERKVNTVSKRNESHYMFVKVAKTSDAPSKDAITTPCLVDSGAECTMFTWQMIQQLGIQRTALTPPKERLLDATDRPMNGFLGYADVYVCPADAWGADGVPIRVSVMTSIEKNILGVDALRALGLPHMKRELRFDFTAGGHRYEGRARTHTWAEVTNRTQFTKVAFASIERMSRDLHVPSPRDTIRMVPKDLHGADLDPIREFESARLPQHAPWSDAHSAPDAQVEEHIEAEEQTEPWWRSEPTAERAPLPELPLWLSEEAAVALRSMNIHPRLLEADTFEQLCRVVEKYKAVFSEDHLPSVPDREKAVIKLAPGKLPKTPRRIPPNLALLKKVEAELQRMLERGEIRVARGRSEWLLNAWAVLKKSLAVRIVLDAGPLNQCLIDEQYIHANVEAILNALKGSDFLSCNDLLRGYFQITLDEDSKKYTRFTVPGINQVYEYNVLAMGLSFSAAAFQRIVREDLQDTGIDLSSTQFYVDDSITATKGDALTHLKALENLWRALHEKQYRVRASKVALGFRGLDFLGFVVSGKGIAPSPQKAKAILEYAEPRTKKQLRAFLGMVNFSSRFIPHYDKLHNPLSDLLKGSRQGKIRMTDATRKAFTDLKEAVRNAVALTHPDFSKRFRIYCDASDEGCGGALAQIDEKGDLKYVDLAAMKFSPAVRNYSARERELFAICHYAKLWYKYFALSGVDVYSDHQSLRHLRMDANPRVLRSALLLNGMPLRIHYLPGEQQVVADALSRNPAFLPPPKRRATKIAKALRVNVTQLLTVDETDAAAGKDHPFAAQTIREEQVHDETAKQITATLAGDHEEASKTHDFWTLSEEGVLFHRRRSSSKAWRVYMPVALRRDALHWAHDRLGHRGVGTTYKRLQSCVYWPQMRKSVQNYVGSCIRCKRAKATERPSHGILQTTSLPQFLERVHVDHAGPFTKSKEGYQYACVFTDKMSRWVDVFPARSTTAEEFIETVQKYVLRNGLPKVIVADNGPAFKSKQVVTALEAIGSRIKLVLPHSSRSNGAAERVVRQLNEFIRANREDNDISKWPNLLDAFAFAHNTAIHESTGESPWMLSRGRDPRLASFPTPPESETAAASSIEEHREQTMYALSLAQEHARTRHQTYVQQRMNKVNEKQTPFAPLSIGDLVVYSTPTSDTVKGSKKLQFKADGPYRVSGIRGKSSVLIVDLRRPSAPAKQVNRRQLHKLETREEMLPEHHARRKERATKSFDNPAILQPKAIARPPAAEGPMEPRFGVPEMKDSEEQRELDKQLYWPIWIHKKRTRKRMTEYLVE